MSGRGFFLALLVTATSLFAQMPPPEDGHRPFGPHRGGRPFISPMGQPFRNAPDNAAAWFAEADADHDGRLTLAEFRADAMRFFTTLDTNHDGEIGPEEIEHYEQDVAPEASAGGGFGDGGEHPGGGKGGSHGGRGGHGGGMGGHGGGMGGGHGGMGGGMGGGGGPPGGGDGDESHPSGPAFDPTQQGAARFSYLALPEPVIAADTDFNRGVSEQEFLTAATRRFALLDPNHDGVIMPDELPKLGGAMRPGRGVRHGDRHGPPPPPSDD